MNINKIESYNKISSLNNLNPPRQNFNEDIADSYCFSGKSANKKSVNFGNSILKKFNDIAKEKYANLSNMQIFKGLEEHFFKLNNKLIHEITLTTEQKEKMLTGKIACGFPQKQLLIYKALGYKGEMNDYFTSDCEELNKYCSKEFLNSTNAKIYCVTYKLTEENGKIKLTPEVKPTQYNSLSEVITGENLKASDLTCGTGNKEYSDNEKEQRYILTSHAYNFMNYNTEDESITLNDPYNSAFPHTITKEKFDNLYTQLTCFPQIF